MPVLTRKPGANEDGRDFLGQRGSDHPSAETEDVHVVMLDGLVSRVRIVADGRPDSREFIGGDRDAGPTAAYEEAPVGAAVGERGGHCLGRIGIVNRRC